MEESVPEVIIHDNWGEMVLVSMNLIVILRPWLNDTYYLIFWQCSLDCPSIHVGYSEYPTKNEA